MRSIFLTAALLVTGCCAYPGQVYVEADRSTYEWARPKLEEWAEAKGGPWPDAVKVKFDSVDARISQAEAKGAESQ